MIQVTGDINVQNDTGFFDSAEFGVSILPLDTNHNSDKLIVSLDIADDISIEWDEFGLFVTLYDVVDKVRCKHYLWTGE